MDLPNAGAYVMLNNSKDWKWYKASLDLDARYEHCHVGEPNSYPCRVKSRWEDDPTGRFTYIHTFSYLVTKEEQCEQCGHISKTTSWSDFVD